MKFVKQTKVGADGNCLSACIASLLEIDIDSIPEVSDYGWLEELNSWLIPNHGVEMLKVLFCDHYPSSATIAVGESSRRLPHAVIYQGDSEIFDPHPSNDGLGGEPEYFIVLLKHFG